MKSEILIRLATAADLSAIEKVGDALFDHPIKRNRAKEFFADKRHHLFLAFERENVVGMASGFHYVHPDKNPSLFINEVGVLESHRNQGIGRTLVKHLWEYAKSLDCQDAWIGTENSNQVAQRCYQAAGMKPDDEPFILFEFENF